MDNEQLNTDLYKMLFMEQQQFRNWLLTQDPETILDNAYEYMIREDIVYAMECHTLSDDQAKALLHAQSPLKDVYHTYEKMEGTHMDDILSSIESRANTIILEEKEALRVLPVYTQSVAYSKEHGEYELHSKSLQANVLCRTAIEDAITEHYANNRLDTAGAKAVLDQFGEARTCYVLAATIQDKDWDGRISDQNKEWAKGFAVPLDKTSWNTTVYRRFVISGTHPGLIDLFTNQVRKEIEQLKEKKPSVLKKLKETETAQPSKAPVKQREADR